MMETNRLRLWLKISIEIVKHYNLPTKVKNQNHLKRKNNNDKGTYDWEKDTILLDHKGSKTKRLYHHHTTRNTSYAKSSKIRVG